MRWSIIAIKNLNLNNAYKGDDLIKKLIFILFGILLTIVFTALPLKGSKKDPIVLSENIKNDVDINAIYEGEIVKAYNFKNGINIEVSTKFIKDKLNKSYTNSNKKYTRFEKVSPYYKGENKPYTVTIPVGKSQFIKLDIKNNDLIWLEFNSLINIKYKNYNSIDIKAEKLEGILVVKKAK